MKEAKGAGAVADEREAHYGRNLFLLTSVETLWGFGMAFGFSASFIQLVLKGLGATPTQIGLLAAQWGIGTIPMLLAGYYTGHFRRKKAAVVWGHYICVLPVVALAASLYWLPTARSKVWAVLAAEYAFGLTIGLLVPVWLTFMGKVMPPRKLGAGFGITFFFQTLAAWGAAQFAASILKVHPHAVAHCVMATAGVMAVANIFFIPIREPESEFVPPAQALGPYIRGLYQEFRGQPVLRTMLLAEVLFAAQTGIVGFYAARAGDFGADVVHGAKFTATVAIAQAVSSLLGGFLVDRIGPKPVLVAGRLAVAAAGLLAWRATSVSDFTLVAVAIGVFWGVRSSAGFAMFRAVCQREEVTGLYGFFVLLAAPFAAGIPLLAGQLLERHLVTAPVLFVSCSALVFASIVVLVLGVRAKKVSGF